MEYKEILLHKSVKPSFIRIKVLEFLDKNRIHPTVDEIYFELCKEIPTLSKTSIYNTVKILNSNNIVSELTIDEKQIRYDFETKNHSHLRCDVCGNVFDVTDDENPPKFLNGYRIREKKVYYSGICKRCLRDNKI